MKTIAIMNYKGGVGKTVTTINFAAELAAAGKRVIVMDADGQCNLSDIFRADTMHGGTTYEVLIDAALWGCWDEIIQETPIDGVKIVPASAELPKADIAALTGERLAKNGIRDFCLAVAEDEGADYILIDCPTAYNAATVAALGAADEIIIPVELEGFSLHGRDPQSGRQHAHGQSAAAYCGRADHQAARYAHPGGRRAGLARERHPGI